MKIFQKSFIFLSLFVFSIHFVYGATGKISGYIFDKETNKPIPDANIIILNTKFGAASRDGGFYFIENLPPGKYDVMAKVIGYEQQTARNVQVQGTTVLNFSLSRAAIEFDPVIVTATLSGHRLSQVSVASEVLTRSRLKQKTGTTIGEAMESLAGVYFNSYDGIAGPHTASIRGSNADQVVVLLDGLRLNTAQGGGVDLNLLPVSAVEKIEVVRGGHSALLGSDAIGGAIQLVSKETIGLHGFSYGINSSIGSYGTRTLDLSGSHKIGLFSYFVNFNQTRTDGDFSYKVPGAGDIRTRQNNDYKGNNLFVKTKLDLGSNNKISFLFHHLTAQKGNAGSVNINVFNGLPMLTPNARAESTRQLFALKSENQVTAHLRLKAQPFYQAYDYHYTDPDGWSPVDDKHQNSAFGLNLQALMNVNSYLDFIAGTELRQDRLQSTKFEVDDRNMQALYLQSELRAPFSIMGVTSRVTAIPAIRWDNYSDVGSQLSPKLGWLVTTGEESSLSLRGNIDKSYRVPTFDDLYWPDEGWGRGNPGLKPETSTNFDAGLVFDQKSSFFSRVEVDYFNNEIEDLISWGTDNQGIWMPLNIGRAKTSGIETGVQFRLPAEIAYLEIFHTWMKATDETPRSATEGKRLVYRPGSKLDVQLGSKIKQFSINFNYRRVSKRYILGDNSVSLPEYDLLNGNASFSLPLANFVVAARIQVLNLLDKSIYAYDGYPLPGREVRIGLGVTY